MKLPQFCLRDLFWLALVCALAVGWWVERTRLQSENRRLAEAGETSWERAYDWQVDETALWLEQQAYDADERTTALSLLRKWKVHHASRR